MKKIVIPVVLILVLLLVVIFSKNNNEPANMEGLPETSGLHIMPDGTIMDALGKPVPNATIMGNGNIRLEDGRVLMPMGDFRN